MPGKPVADPHLPRLLVIRRGVGSQRSTRVVAISALRLITVINVDALGGFGLQSPRTRSETADQHLILEPALTIVAYDDTGWSATAHVETR